MDVDARAADLARRVSEDDLRRPMRRRGVRPVLPRQGDAEVSQDLAFVVQIAGLTVDLDSIGMGASLT
jgi:hypothetical protein